MVITVGSMSRFEHVHIADVEISYLFVSLGAG